VRDEVSNEIEEGDSGEEESVYTEIKGECHPDNDE
jgi:hypothetical protein